ncbi:MAG: adenylate/guanylate cyclase domain-containing protein [Rhodospirillaceae bacterium]|jgi:class 3 adenylate cyclase|nr:adenylate/guanylate cyclase domain-containing protein [Rhodospirillales bacterium]MBT3905882.1 adenylate/guanylate cyclase domain-containing protein [Rhodospirillaceae bacterium]MBT4702806.1 adenylate/guanylate cyclase domain-containing protein [Rhodospirillaceae bacterium]MBT5036839.1 adenylate/guanylate cyclase domain-containing protein [Rhodospirillaceae bacterium]MBT6218418.1 adenylate/guanylate cyclase domain-containing protein [Rhodospirillaceae bacterium]
MSFELFEKEQNIIAEAKELLSNGGINDPKSRDAFAELLKNYEKLSKSTKRLVRVSDRNEAELNKVAKSLDEKNAMLEGLSSKLSKYLSPQIYESIFSGEQAVQLRTERKKLTIFFSDIKDFTATTDDLEPEDITFLVNDYLTEMSEIALKHGATIDKFIGDAILIFFGDPTTNGVQEDALSCVRMAIDMQRHMVGLRAKWTEMGYARPFQVRIGISTGYCNVGNFGSEERMDYTIIGGEVNLAARLESVADPDGITIAYETYALVKDFVDAEKGDTITVKGIHRKISPYKLIGIFKDINEKSRFLRAENDGMKLFLDFDKLDEETGPQTIKEIKSALKRLTKLEKMR